MILGGFILRYAQIESESVVLTIYFNCQTEQMTQNYLRDNIDGGERLSTRMKLLLIHMNKSRKICSRDQFSEAQIFKQSLLTVKDYQQCLFENESLMKHYRRKQGQAVTCQKNYSKTKCSFEPAQIDLLQGLGDSYFLKTVPKYSQSQPYEIRSPFLIVSLKQVLQEGISQIVVAMANEEKGGFIVICHKKSKQKQLIKIGLTEFTLNEASSFRRIVKDSVKEIAFHHDIELKFESIPIYEDYKELFSLQKPREFIIKITIAPKSNQRHLFFIQGQLSYCKPAKRYFSICQLNQQQGKLFSVKQVRETDIYSLIQNAASKKLRSNNRLSINSKFNSKVTLTLEQFIMNLMTIKQQPLCRFPFNPNQVLLSCLSALAKLSSQQIYCFFPKIGPEQSVVHLQVSEQYPDTVSLIKTILKQSKISFKYIQPLPDFQKDYFAFRKKQKATALVRKVSYLLLQGSFIDFNAGILNLFKNEFDDRIIMSEVTEKVIVGAPIQSMELQGCQNFLWQFFDSIPKLKNDALSKCVTQIEVSQNNPEFIFAREDRNVATFLYFLLTLCNKRPH